MSTDPQFADTQAPDFKVDLIEQGRKLLELQEQNRITRAAQLADRAHATALQEIKNTTIGK
jgi:hypothetical protein